jgi:hypothetical protein
MLLERIITASNLIAFGSCDPAIVTPDYGFNFGFEDRSAIPRRVEICLHTLSSCPLSLCLNFLRSQER